MHMSLIIVCNDECRGEMCEDVDGMFIVSLIISLNIGPRSLFFNDLLMKLVANLIIFVSISSTFVTLCASAVEK